MDQRTLHNLSLCTGGAGLDLGLQLALGGVRTVCYVEHEAAAIEILAEAMETGCLDESPVFTDVRSFDGCPWRGVVDTLTAGYPCQPFSKADRRCGRDDSRHLWPHVRRIIGETEPGIVFLENVSDHLNLGLPEVVQDLRRMNYAIAAGLFTAAEVGSSQGGSGFSFSRWPTPTAHDYRTPNSIYSQNHWKRDWCKGQQLNNFVAHYFRPDPKAPSGAERRTTHLRRLNPRFVCWLMGWHEIVPIGSGFSATAWCLFRQRMRSALCGLLSEK